MRLRNLLGVAAGTVGVTALANRLLTARAGSFDPLLDGTRGTYRWRGFDVAYVEAGSPDDPDLVLLHAPGITGSSGEFHRVADRLAEDYHVVAPDLPGFGHSDRPPLVYSASLLRTFVADFLADVTETPAVVASGRSGAYAALAAEETDVSRLLLVCPTTGDGGRRPLRRAVLRSALLGEAGFNALASTWAIRGRHARRDVADGAALSIEFLDHEWATSHQPGGRFAPASLLSGFLDPDADLASAIAAVPAPTTLVWGEDATDPDLQTGRDLAERADAGLVVIDHSKRRPHLEHGPTFADVVVDT